MSNTREYFSLEDLSSDLQKKINGFDDENISKYGLDEIYENTIFKFRTHSDSGLYEPFERIENTVYRYINGSVSLVDSASEGINEESYNAIIQLKAEFIVPLLGPEEKNRELLNAIRLLLTNELKYSTTVEPYYYDPNNQSVLYTHITDYSIATTGIRDQREIIGDSITITIDITHTFVALGVSSNAIIVKVRNTRTNRWEIVGYTRLGIARKSVCDTNVYSNSGITVPSTQSTPSNTVLTISMDLLTRVSAFDYFVSQYTYKGDTSPIEISITYPDPSAPQETFMSTYQMVFETAGINAELDKISSTSVTLIEAKTF